jgi:lipopolysaccharide transport system permease protein
VKIHSSINSPQVKTQVTVIEPVHRWVPLNLHEIFEFRDLLRFLIQREIKSRYRQMALGPLWIVLAPILNMVIFTIIFGKVAQLPSDGIPYPLFSYAALLPWTFFSTAATTAANSLQSYKNIISKVYFPRLVVPLAGIISALVDFGCSFLVLLGMMAWYGFWPSWGLLIIPLLLVVTAAAGLAVGLWFATWIVHFRDVGTILNFGLRAFMYAAPVVYAMSIVPERWLFWYRLNPIANVIDSFRWALLGKGTAPDVLFAASVLIIVPFLISGAYYFRRTERNIVDIA